MVTGLGTKILVAGCVVILMVVMVFLILYQTYTWYCNRVDIHSLPTRYIFYLDPTGSIPRGLDRSVLQSLPVFTHSPESEPLDCAVCLSEFEDMEVGRLLPLCNHSFHIDCIDMWFQSHSTCPLCRTVVEAVPFWDDDMWREIDADFDGDDEANASEGNGKVAEGVHVSLEIHGENDISWMSDILESGR